MRVQPSLSEAVIKLRPNSAFIISNEDYSTLEWMDPNTVPPSFEEVKIEYDKLIQEYESYDYWRKRRAEYPKIEDQLDILYHEGYEGWRNKIKEIKDKYPKLIGEEN